MFRLAEESAEELWEVEQLYDLAFAPGRTALSSYQLREGVAPIAGLCLAARDAFGALGGAIRYWPIEIRGAAGRWPCLLLGPVAVHPIRQGEGLGAELIFDSLARAERLGWRRVLLIGDEPYYGRFGFARSAALGVRFPAPTNPNRILARPLAPEAMAGVAGDAVRWRGDLTPWSR
ncbi:MAG: N-acetyltransferase [Pseudomonadota bacterium]